MGCQCTDSSEAQAWTTCEGNPVVDAATPDSILQQYAAAAGASSSGSKAWVMCLAVAFMRARRMSYAKAVAGDCGGSSVPQVSALQSFQKNSGLALQGTSLGLSIGTAVEGGVANIAGTALGTAVSVVPFVGAAVSLVTSILGIFTGNHAKAVQLEQSTLCGVTTAYNQYEGQIESALSSGQITVTQAAAALQGVVGQLLQALSPISSTSKQNAGWGYGIALQALANYNVAVLYPSLVPGTSSILGGSGGGLLLASGALVFGLGVL